jgi:hypothetical protein
LAWSWQQIIDKVVDVYEDKHSSLSLKKCDLQKIKFYRSGP